jgi:hypothetical protein
MYNLTILMNFGDFLYTVWLNINYVISSYNTSMNLSNVIMKYVLQYVKTQGLF